MLSISWASQPRRSSTFFSHIGTLGVVIFYFRRDIKIVLTCLVHGDFHTEYGRFIPLIIVATIPTGIIGLLYDKFLADNYQTFLIMGITFLIGATLLFLANSAKKPKPNLLPQSPRFGRCAGSSKFSRALYAAGSPFRLKFLPGRADKQGDAQHSHERHRVTPTRHAMIEDLTPNASPAMCRFWDEYRQRLVALQDAATIRVSASHRTASASRPIGAASPCIS